jgi:hypothetical protein
MVAFDRHVPAHRKYCGLSRKIACIVLLAILIAILALIIGLALGLSKRSKYVRLLQHHLGTATKR